MQSRLIQANIALFQGQRGETRRLIQEFLAENGTPPPGSDAAAQLLWLEAQSSESHEEQIQRLYHLVASLDPNNPYSKMAREYLADEQRYSALIRPEGQGRAFQFLNVPFWKMAFFILIGGFVVFGLMTLLEDRSPAVSTPVEQVSQPTAAPAPDRSRVLVSSSFSARYPDGILQLTAIEDPSERVIDLRSGQTILPVPGARFYTLSMVFECRGGICNEPPEADLFVLLENETRIEARQDVAVSGERRFEPIALGRTTAGWVIFEIPVSIPVRALLIFPANAENDTPPLEIDLSSVPN